MNFDDTNKFPDWRLTVDIEIEHFRELLQNEHFWTRMFNVNRLLHLSEWWTEPNAQKTQLGLMKNVRRSFLRLLSRQNFH